MLFDLQSPRRRVAIKIIYGALAFLIGGSLLLTNFGGSDGGIGDLFGNSASPDSGFEDQVKEAEGKAAASPQDPAAQLELARIHFLVGNSSIEADPETGQAIPTAESIEEFQRTADAWDQYLKLLGNKPPNSDVATLVSQAYVALAQSATTAAAADSSIMDAAAAQQIVADARPSQGAFSNLAIYLLFSGDTAAGDAAIAKAAELAPAPQRQALTKQLEQIKTQAAKFRKEVDAAAKAAKTQGGAQGAAPGAPAPDPFQNPLSQDPSIGGGLGGASGLGG